MGFSCPRPGGIGFNVSYGLKPITGADVNGRITNITCNMPGVVYYLSSGGLVSPSMMFVLSSLVVVGMLFV